MGNFATAPANDGSIGKNPMCGKEANLCTVGESEISEYGDCHTPDSFTLVQEEDCDDHHRLIVQSNQD